jgi:hypothetical protein
VLVTLGVCLAAAALSQEPALAQPEVTPSQVAAMLAALHPDYTLFIGDVRYGSTRLRPATLYAGLVRRGGRDPRDPDDGPDIGRGVRNDLVIYADTFEAWRTTAWRLLLLDHEYFHARHMARRTDAPAVGFGQPRADADYREALAWGYVLGRAREGVYGALSAAERAEAAERYREHFTAFRGYVRRLQPSAWAHYGRFLPEPGSALTRAGAAPGAGTAPLAVLATK